MPDDAIVQALIAEGRECLHECEYDQAIAIGKKLEKCRQSYAFELMAFAHAAKGELPTAIDVLERGVTRAPDVWLLWLQLGNYYSDMTRYGDARQAYARALACPTVDPSSVYYNSAMVSVRQRKFTDALEELDHVTSKELKLKAASLRISTYIDMGQPSVAIDYAEQLLVELTTNNEEEMGEGEAADYASFYGEYAYAVWKHGNSQHALELAWQAVSIWKQVNTALWLIREIEGKHSSQARYHRLMIEGIWPESWDDEDAASGFFVTYGVVANDPDEAFHLAVRFEPSDIRQSLRIDECEVSPELYDLPKGVYDISYYFTFPAEDSN